MKKYIYQCDDCGFEGDGDNFYECDVHDDHGFCPRCHGTVVWDAREIECFD